MPSVWITSSLLAEFEENYPKVSCPLPVSCYFCIADFLQQDPTSSCRGVLCGRCQSESRSIRLYSNLVRSSCLSFSSRSYGKRLPILLSVLFSISAAFSFGCKIIQVCDRALAGEGRLRNPCPQVSAHVHQDTWH